MKQSIKKDYLWNTIGVMLQNATSPILLLIVTRLNGIEASGTFSFAFAVSILLWALGMWGGRTYQVSDTRGEFSQRSYVMVRLLLSIAMMIIAAGFSVANNYPFEMTALIIVLTLFKVVESYSDVLYGVLQLHDRLYLSGISLTVKSLAGVLLFAIVDLITGDILYASLSVVLINLVVLFFYDLRWTKKYDRDILTAITKHVYIREAFTIMKKCSGVFVVFFLALFSLNIPRYFIEKYNPEEVGYFGVIAMPITLIVLLMTFILQPNILRLSQMYLKKQYKIFFATVNKVLVLSIVIGLAVLIVSGLYGPEILTLIFGVSFEQYLLPLVVIVVGGLASALVAVYLNVYVIMRKIKLPLIVLVVTNIMLVAVSVVAIKGNGLLAGVGLYAITNVVQVVFLMIGYIIMYKRSLSAQKN